MRTTENFSFSEDSYAITTKILREASIIRQAAHQATPLWLAGPRLAVDQADHRKGHQGKPSARVPGVRVPRGKSCDEYPFAATYQGAAFFPHDNSTAVVPAKENSREGGLRVAMYKAERLLAKDAFWVIIKP